MAMQHKVVIALALILSGASPSSPGGSMTKA